MNELFYYEATWYDENDRKNVPYGGFLYASSFAEAAKTIEDYYGLDLISIDKIYGFNNELMAAPVELTREWVKMYDKFDNGLYDEEKETTVEE